MEIDKYGNPIKENEFYVVRSTVFYVEKDGETNRIFYRSPTFNILQPLTQTLAKLLTKIDAKTQIDFLREKANWMEKILAEQEVKEGRS